MVVCGLGHSVLSLGDPHRFRTIGVNDIGRAFTPTYMFCMDAPRTFASDRLHYIQNSQAEFIFTDHDLGIDTPRVVRVPIRRRDTPYLDDANALYFTGRPITSPYMALCLAAHMGAKAIGLIGVDFTADHFFAADGAHKLTGMLAGIDRRYYRLGSEMLERGIKIFNLSAESRLCAFPRLTPDEFHDLQLSGKTHAWTRPAKRIYLYSCAPADQKLIALAQRINTETSCSCRLSAPDSNDVIPGSMPDVEQSIADDSHRDLDCETAPLPAEVTAGDDFESSWNLQVRPLLFTAQPALHAESHPGDLTFSAIVSQEHASREELAETVASLATGLLPADEIIIVRSWGAAHNLPEWLPLSAPVRYLDLEPGESFVAARNRAMESCKGDIFVFTDANVQAPPRWSEIISETFLTTDAAVIGPAIADLYQPALRAFGLNFSDSELNTAPLPKLDDHPYQVPLLSNSFLAVHSDALRHVGGFDNGMRHSGADDLELCFRLWIAGYACYVAPELVVSWMNPFAAGALRPELYWTDLLHNLLRLATTHFSPERLGAFISSASQHAEYSTAAASLISGTLAQHRDRVESLRQYSDDWFFERFSG